MRSLIVAAFALAAATVGSANALPSSRSSPVVAIHADLAVANLSSKMIAAGCESVNHEDYGAGLQLLFGESFEEPANVSGISGSSNQTAPTWMLGRNTTSDHCDFAVVQGDAVTGSQSQAIASSASLPAGSSCSIVNMGLDAGGLSLQASIPFSGYLFTKALEAGAGGALLQVALINSGGEVLASATIPVPPSSDWTRRSFTLIPRANASCFEDKAPISPCAPNAEGGCYSCRGQFAISLLSSGSTMLLDQAYLENTGQRHSASVATRRDVVKLLGSGEGMGLNAMRYGGSAILVDGYRWKRFRGEPALRQPYKGWWYAFTSPGWSIFEFLALCEVEGAHAIVTLNSAETPGDMADFLEYAYGSATATVWGAMRASDGRQSPYPPFSIEIGNEQDHTSPTYIAQVVGLVGALNTTAAALALPFRLQVIVGTVPITWPPQQAVAMATALALYTPFLDLLWDFHVGGDSPHSEPVVAAAFLASVAQVFHNVSRTTGTPPLRGAVLEENGSRHDIQRALGRARMSNRFHCMGDFVQVDSPANGLQVYGRNDNSWDQGQLFVTQEGAYLSPAGIASTLLAASSFAGGRDDDGSGPDVLLAVAADALPPQIDLIAVRDAAGSRVALRVVNLAKEAFSAPIAVSGCTLTNATALATVLSGNLTAQNTPSAPTRVAAARSAVVVGALGAQPSFTYAIPPLSFAVLVLQCSLAATAAPQPPTPGKLAFATTCDTPSTTPTLSWHGHALMTFNLGPWALLDGGASIALYGNTYHAFDQAVVTDSSLPPAADHSWVSTNLTFLEQPDAQAAVDAGLLVRCTDGMGPGPDAFNCFEVSISANKGSQPGYAMIGAHTLPGNYEQLAKVPWDVPIGISTLLMVNMTTASAATLMLDVWVGGKQAIHYEDSKYTSVLNGGGVAVRSFYSDVRWEGLAWGLTR